MAAKSPESLRSFERAIDFHPHKVKKEERNVSESTQLQGMIVFNSVWGLGLVHDPVILEGHTQEVRVVQRRIFPSALSVSHLFCTRNNSEIRSWIFLNF